MNTLEMLGIALGLGTLAGLNLYLTVFVTGLAVRFGWVVLPDSLHQLAMLGDIWIISVAGGLYFLQFFADKIPWVDSINDAIHTLVRPIGAALLAVLALGQAHPVVTVIAALLAGGAALTSHAAKAGTRLIANASPEPISNVGLSLGEDGVVLAGLALLAWHPVIAAVIFVLLLLIIWLVLPRILRATRATLWLAWCKLNQPAAGDEASDGLSRKIPDSHELLLRRVHATTETILLAVPCLSGGGPRLPRNLFGWLVRFEGGRLFFVSRTLLGSVVSEIPLQDITVLRESRFLTEKLALTASGQPDYIFQFDRGRKALADLVAHSLKPSAPIEPALVAEA